jgi:dihydrofolate reductase
MTMNIALIAAMATNRVIGRNNNLPWHLPNDLKYFKQATMGKPIMMGRKTFESIGRPLPGRTNIVITRDQAYSAEGIRVVHSIEEALVLAESIALLDGAEELMVIGGEQLYQAVLPRAQRLYLTHVHAEVEGDAWFPVIDFDQWQELGREDFSADGPNPYDYSFVVYSRNE